jgi:hypothetical protein
MQEPKNVFNKCPSRSEFPDDAVLLVPEPGPLGGLLRSSEPSLFSGHGFVLTGKSAADDVNSFKVMFFTILHVIELFYIRKMLLQYLPGKRVYFDTPDGFNSRPAKTKFKSANPRKQAPVSELG